MKHRIANNDRGAAPAVPARAFVHFGAVELGYTRSGRGSAVIVIASNQHVRSGLRTALEGHLRVIAPDNAAGWSARRYADWLPAFVDSLGIVQPHLVVFGSPPLPLLRIAAGDADRIRRIVLISHLALPPGVRPGRRERPGSEGHQPLLSILCPYRRIVITSEERERILDFLTR